MEPLGAIFAAELPLLLHHHTDTPVGVARFDPPTPAGITFEAELPIVEELGPVKDEVDRAWTSIKHKLIRGVSIGFKAIAGHVEALESGGRRFLKSEILELSLVTVPANQSATIAVIKSLDLAASGPAASASRCTRAKAAPTMTTSEQTCENQRGVRQV